MSDPHHTSAVPSLHEFIKQSLWVRLTLAVRVERVAAFVVAAVAVVAAEVHPQSHPLTEVARKRRSIDYACSEREAGGHIACCASRVKPSGEPRCQSGEGVLSLRGGGLICARRRS